MSIPDSFILNNKTYYKPQQPNPIENSRFYLNSNFLIRDIKNFLHLSTEQSKKLALLISFTFSIKDLLKFISENNNVINCNVFYSYDEYESSYLEIEVEKTKEKIEKETILYNKELKKYVSIYEKYIKIINQEKELLLKNNIENELNLKASVILTTALYKKFQTLDFESKQKVLNEINKIQKNSNKSKNKNIEICINSFLQRNDDKTTQGS